MKRQGGWIVLSIGRLHIYWEAGRLLPFTFEIF